MYKSISLLLVSALTASPAMAARDLTQPNGYYNVGVHYYPAWYNKGRDIVNNPNPATRPDLTRLPWDNDYPWLEIKRYNINYDWDNNGVADEHWAQTLNDYRIPQPAYLGMSLGSNADDINNPYYYNAADPVVLQRQVDEMWKKGINFVVFNWYWNFDKDPAYKFGPYHDHAVKAFKAASKPSAFKYALMWDTGAGSVFGNPDNPVNTMDDFRTVFTHLVDNHFKHASYLRMASPRSAGVTLPVFYITNMTQFRDMSRVLGKHPRELLNEANAIAISKGLSNGIYFMASHDRVPGSTDQTFWPSWVADAGFDGLFAYNYHNDASGGWSESYLGLDGGYRKNWTDLFAILESNGGPGGITAPAGVAPSKNANMTYHVPVTSGWNAGPWRKHASTDPVTGRRIETPTYNSVAPHDLSQPPTTSGNVTTGHTQFAEHLRAARSRLQNKRSRTQNTVIICCWNEFGEGSFIEPTRTRGTAFTDVVNSVFFTEPDVYPSTR